MEISSKHVSVIFLVIFFVTIKILSPFSQAAIPVGVSQAQHYSGKGFGPVIEIPHPNIGVDIYVVEGSPALYYSNVVFLGNLFLNILVLSCAVYFWKRG